MVKIREEEFGTSVKWSSITLSEIIKRDKRLEASVFNIEAKKAWQIIEKNKYEVIYLGGEEGLVEQAFYPGRFKRIYCNPENGEEFFLPSQMIEINPKAEKWISKSTKCNFNKLRVEKNTLLLTRSGTIGNVTLVSKTLENKIFSDDVIRIKFKNILDLGYVYAYLKTKTGSLILQTNGYGAVITHLEPEHLSEILIPNPPNEIKEQIHNLIIESFKLRDEANELTNNAIKLLENELKLIPINKLEQENNEINSFKIKLSELEERIDGSYHIPINKKIEEILKKNSGEITTMADPRITKKIILAGIFKRIYVEEGYGIPFLGGKEITQLNPKVEKFLSYPYHKERYEKELKISENMILVTDRGSIGIVALVPKHWNNLAVSQNVLKVIPANNEIAGYIYVYLNSEWGKSFLCKETYGAVVDMIDDKSLAKVKVPLLKSKEIQNKINNMALEANEKLYMAYELEKKALEDMNKVINS